MNEKKKVSLVSSPDPSPDKDNKEDTIFVHPYLARALCLRLGDGSAVPVHDRPLGTRGGSIAADVSDGTGRGERPPGQEGEPGAETTFRS